MPSSSTRAALGLGALFLGGMLGGLVGTLFLRAPAAPSPGSTSPRNSSDDSGLRAAVEALTVEVRALGLRAPARDGPGDTVRAPMDDDGTPQTQDFGDLIAAIESLTRALGSARSGVAQGGIGISPLQVPPEGPRVDTLSRLEGRSAQDISQELRFLTYQQVLERFGRPQEVSDGAWYYPLSTGDGERLFTFRFQDGYLINVYP